jgi:aryl-alcohol dehydrogenase-like predicted oxidoreductase
MSIDLGPRTVPGTDLKIGRLILGTMTFGAQVSELDAGTMVRRALDSGITMFDTANAYNAGVSEEILGRVVKPFRQQVQVATKLGMSKVDPRPLARDSIKREFDASLKRLGMDHVEVLYIHLPDHKTPFDEVLSCLDEIVRSGKALHVAQSNHAAWQLTQYHALAERHSWPKMRISQQMHSLLARRVEGDYQECARHLGLLNIAYNPLAGGLLTGKHARGPLPQSGRFSQEHYRVRYWNERQFDAVERLQEIARQEGVTMVEMSLRWLLAHTMSDCVILGASSLQQLEANIAAASGKPLSTDALKEIDDVWSGLRGAAPNYYR